MKKDAGKIRMELLDGVPRALRLCAAVLTCGAAKYEDNGYHKVPGGLPRYAGARLRHYNAAAEHVLDGGDLLGALDEETNLPHLAHAVVSALIELELALSAADRCVDDYWHKARMPEPADYGYGAARAAMADEAERDVAKLVREYVTGSDEDIYDICEARRGDYCPCREADISPCYRKSAAWRNYVAARAATTEEAEVASGLPNSDRLR